MAQPNYKLTALGCKVNQYDLCAIESALQEAGLKRAPRGAANVNLVAVATCCVTTTAMRKSRQAVSRAVRNSPGAAVLVVGCYCDYDAGRVSELLESLNVPPDRAIVAGHHAGDLPERIRQLAGSLQRPGGDSGQAGRLGNDLCTIAACDACRDVPPDHTSITLRRMAAVKHNVSATRDLPPVRKFPGHQRAFVKVQDGCDAFCAYCVVPYARSVVWSRTVRQVLDECGQLVAAGHREIVLSGVFLGAYGRKSAVRRRWKMPCSPLVELVRQVARIDGLWRLRLSSLEPADLNDELLGLWGEVPNLAPHFHLPLQSGSTRILRKMNRQYTADDYRRTLDRLQWAVDRPAITTDIIVGFPDESDRDFARTLEMVRLAGFSKIHAFPFSAIEGTAAWSWRDRCPPAQVVGHRMAELARLEREMAAAYRGRFVGMVMEGLVESARGAGGFRRAMTDRYLTVRFRPQPGVGNLTGTVIPFRIEGVCEGGLEGTVAGG